MTAYFQLTQTALPYIEDTSALFATLCLNKPHTLLLDSAEIQSRNSTKSLLFAQAALTIRGEGNHVEINALTENGQSLLPQIATRLASLAQPPQVQLDTTRLAMDFLPLDENLDEDSKLHATTLFDALRVIKDLYADAPAPIYLGGLFGYDLVANFIPMDGIQLEDDGLACPDLNFYLAEQLIFIDHESQTASLHSFTFDPACHQAVLAGAEVLVSQLNSLTYVADLPLLPASDTIHTNHGDEKFKGIVEKLKHHIHIGDVFQIVPSRRFSLACPNPLASYRQLKINNPSPYMFFLQVEDFILFGASPESALKFAANTRQLEIYPIAGSRPRGFDAEGNIDQELDSRLELELRLDKKELAEHLMLVDLARNDIARVCETGSRQVADLMQIDRYSHIMHLVSRVIGTLRPELDALHAYQACMNMGTLTGAPKIKAMQLIYQFEQQKRHTYGGAVGYLTSEGNFDTCIVIRSAFVQNGLAYVQAGCGEVLDSDPQFEMEETKHKSKAVLKAILDTNARAVQ